MINQPTGDSLLVLVSHSGEDTWVARQIANGISAKGAQPFPDEADVDVGAEVEEDIRRFLDEIKAGVPGTESTVADIKGGQPCKDAKGMLKPRRGW